MSQYVIDAERYYNGINDDLNTSSGHAFAGAVNVFLSKPAMNGLIERYSLFKKSILSLGSGTAFEEYWFHQAGCKLVLNDLDIPTHNIEKYLITLPQAGATDFVFWIDDADNALTELPAAQFDALYVSSFHPDEIRREQIQEEFKARRSADEAYRNVTWPSDALPYSNTLVSAISKVKAGGIAIFQHYRGGVYVDSNPHYIDAIRSQFREHGAELLETYAFRKSPPHMLAVAYKGTAYEAQEYAQEVLSSRPEIQTFHGRYPDESIKTDVVKTFDISNPAVSPQRAFRSMATEIQPQQALERGDNESGCEQEMAKSAAPDETGLLVRVVRVATNPLRLYRAIEWRIRAAIARVR